MGGAGKYLWEKRSGTGNTGWQPIGSPVKGSIVGAPSNPYLGMMYLHNDGSAGSKTKPVWWDGSDWVDANGDTV